MTDPADARFRPSHEWVRMVGAELIMGVSDYAQHMMHDIIHVELPEPDDHYEAGEEFIVLESLRTAMDFHAPVAGRVTAINHELLTKPELINDDPYGDGWLLRMEPDDATDADALMDCHEYESMLPDDNVDDD